MLISVRVTTMKGLLYSFDVSRVAVSGVGGEMEILPGHADMYASVLDDCIVLGGKTSPHYIWVTGGVLEVLDGNAVTVYCKSAIDVAEMDGDDVDALLVSVDSELKALSEEDEKHADCLMRYEVAKKIEKIHSEVKKNG